MLRLDTVMQNRQTMAGRESTAQPQDRQELAGMDTLISPAHRSVSYGYSSGAGVWQRTKSSY